MADCIIQSRNAIRAEIFGKKLSITSKIILLRSTPYDHTEFQFSERYDRISFSATLQDDDKGTRFKHITYFPEGWDSIIIPMTNEEEDFAWHEAKKLEGMPYDLIGQLAHITKFKIWRPSKKKIWCTKAVGRLVYEARPDFYYWLYYLIDVTELRPDQMYMMAKYYFKNK